MYSQNFTLSLQHLSSHKHTLTYTYTHKHAREHTIRHTHSNLHTPPRSHINVHFINKYLQIYRCTLLLHEHRKCLRAHIWVLPCTTYAHTCKHKKHTLTHIHAHTHARESKSCAAERLVSLLRGRNKFRAKEHPNLHYLRYAGFS